MKTVVVFLFALFTAVSCSNTEQEKTIVEVYDQTLSENILQQHIDEHSLNSDSATSANVFIKNWIKNKVLTYNASNAKLAESNEIEKKVDNYRSQLLIHHYQNKLITERLDTIVSSNEIKEYYISHQPDFQLKDYLVKVLYIKVAEDAPEIEKIGNWYKLRKEENENSLVQYAGLYATNFYFDKDNWIYFDEITKEIPLSDINKDRFITKKSKLKFKENGYYYFLNILDYKLKNGVSPVEFEKNNIKERILNTRILKLRETINTELLKKAENENAIKKY